MFSINLQSEEVLLGAFRQSKAVLLKPFFIAAIAITVPLYLLSKYGLLNDYWKAASAWSGLFLLYLLYKLLVWDLNVLLVTNKRLISASYQSLFKKDVYESPWQKIANIGFRTRGVLASLFRYGDLNVHISHITETIVVRNMPKTAELKDLLWKVHSASTGQNVS